MASRYLVATGNWSSTSVWSATSGGASGASVPTSSDYAYIDKNYTVTLTADASCFSVTHTNGILTLSSYKLSIVGSSYNGGTFESSGSTARTLNLNSGTLYVNVGLDTSGVGINMTGSNLTLNAGTSLVILEVYLSFDTFLFSTLSKTFNDVQINMGSSGSDSTTLSITGSPTFRSLIIQSKNSAAHTVNFDDSATVTTNKLVAIGSSSSNRLTIKSSGSPAYIQFISGGSSYGQYVNNDGTNPVFTSGATTVYGGNVPTYLGSNSIDGAGLGDWLLQDPPKISTLVDPLTTTPASNTNWTVTGTVTKVTSGHDGGGYTATSGAYGITSTDTYDLNSSQIVFEVVSAGDAMLVTIGDKSFSGSTSYARYNKIYISGTTLYLDGSTDGASYTNITSVSSIEPLRYSSVRLSFFMYNATIGSINPSFGTVYTKTQPSIAHIATKPIKTQPLTARIKSVVNKTQTAIARIGLLSSKTQSSIASISRNSTKTQPTIARVSNTFTKTQPLISHISSIFSKTQSSTTHLVVTVTATQPVTAHIIVSADIKKSYDYKVYDGNIFLGLLPNVVSEFAYSQDINTAGSQITIDVGVSADISALASTTTIDDESSVALQDESGDNLLTEGSTSIVGVGLGQSLIKNGNRVIVYEYSRFYPNGKVMFQGVMERWEASFGGDQGEEKINVLVYSSGQDLDNYVIGTGNVSIQNQSSATATISGGGWGSVVAQSIKPSSTINVGVVSILASIPTGSPVSMYFQLCSGNPTLDTLNIIAGSATYTFGGSNAVIDTSSTSIISSLTPTSYTFTLPSNHLLTSPNSYYWLTWFGPYGGSNVVFETATTGFTLTAPLDKLYHVNATINNASFSPAYDSAHPTLTTEILTIGGNTTSTYTSSDPSTGMLESIMNNYSAQGGLLTYNSGSIDATGLSLTYTFTTNTPYEGIKAALSLAPDGFYYYVDLGSNILYFKASNTVADIIVTKSRDIDNLTVIATIENITNAVLFSGGIPAGGGTTNIYSQFKDSTSIAKYGQHLKRISDNRVTLQPTANALGGSALAEGKDELYQTTVTILDNMMDITLLKPGLIVGFRAYGTFVDGLLAQIVRLEYTSESVKLTLGILPKRLVPEFEKITRGLIAQQTIANPTAPS